MYTYTQNSQISLRIHMNIRTFSIIITIIITRIISFNIIVSCSIDPNVFIHSVITDPWSMLQRSNRIDEWNNLEKILAGEDGERWEEGGKEKDGGGTDRFTHSQTGNQRDRNKFTGHSHPYPCIWTINSRHLEQIIFDNMIRYEYINIPTRHV